MSMKVLVVGGGMITADLILPSLYQLQRAEVIGEITVCALNSGPLRSLAENAEIKGAFPRQAFAAQPALSDPPEKNRPELFGELIAKMQPRQLVVVAVPDQLHYQVVMQALRGDQHVVCVKPLVLQYTQAVEIENRGRSGAFLVSRSLRRLWALAEGGRPLIVALPLASSPRYEALATALKQILNRTMDDAFLIFVRGSRQRLQAVRDGRCHLAVMSGFAANEMCGPDDAVVAELPPLTYNTGHRVFYTAAETPGPLRVIIDQHSADQQLLTALEFPGGDVQYIEAMSQQIARLRVDHRRDARPLARGRPRPAAVPDGPRQDRRHRHPRGPGGPRRRRPCTSRADRRPRGRRGGAHPA